ncbi:MAG: hypothetical protein LUH58_01560 [Lachnospiraceae bacterium]|nr:hypothetical protein [Lachnospiraceae bacterium]
MKISFSLLDRWNPFKVEKSRLDRWAWTFIVFSFCWTDLADYYYWCDIKKLGVWVIAALYFYIRFDVYKKWKKPYMICGVLLGIAGWVYFLRVNFFSFYIYFNYAMGPVLIVWLPLLFDSAVQLYHNIRSKKRMGLSASAVFFYVMTIFILLSPCDELKYRYVAVAVFLIPLCVYDTGEEFRKNLLLGIINGLCIGFVVSQLYSFLFVPYLYGHERYRSYRYYTTFAGESYILFFIALYIKYFLLKSAGAKKWKSALFYLLAVFDLSLMYLAGGRAPVLAVIFVTFVFQGIDVFRRKKEVGFLKKTVRTIWNSALVGILSLVLFPVAFCAVRYMPEILNRPDYLDSIYNRRYSIVTNFLGSHYQYDNEYKQYYQGGMSDLDGMTFAEALTFCLGRIIPGADYIIPDYFYEKAEQNKEDRYAQYLELGYTTQEDYDRYIYELENEDEIIEAWPGDNLDFLEPDEETKGESELNPYFVNIYEASSMEVRSAIHRFAIERLNWTGHEYGEFQFYEGYSYTMELTVLPHAHNVFLIMGYNYGIPAMIAFIAMFAAAVVSSVRTYLKTKRLEELLPAMLIIGMSIFGMYEMAFDFLYDNAYTVMILLCVVGLRTPKKIIFQPSQKNS